ncbi:MAG TPA: YceI family protein [Puia sp.]|nr:YceI family protein [Puia sp.]
MKKAVLFLFAAFGKLAHAQYKPIDNGSVVQFKIKNFGFNVAGSFRGLAGNIRFDPDRLSEASFDVSIDVNTVNTDNDLRDDHLRKYAYLDVKDYPRIRLLSDRVSASTQKGIFLFAGRLTIKNKTMNISFPFTAEPSGGGYHFNGVFSINRKDFDVGGASTISDKLEVSLSVLAK